MRKRIINTLSGLFPNRFVNFAYYKLTHPQVYKLREHEKEILDQAEKSIFKFNEFDIQMYKWEAGPQKVLLIHGWEGQAGNFSDLIEKLLAKNVTVLAFDGPSHGSSSKGKGETSLFEFAELVGVLIDKLQVTKLVSHSFGGVATTYSLSKYSHLKIEKYALFTTPNRFEDRINDVSKNVGLHEKVNIRLKQKLTKELNLDLTKLSVTDFTQNISVKEALIVHDTFDKVLSVEESRAVVASWEEAELKEVTGTGHFRILRTEVSLNLVIDFLAIEE